MSESDRLSALETCVTEILFFSRQPDDRGAGGSSHQIEISDEEKRTRGGLQKAKKNRTKEFKGEMSNDDNDFIFAMNTFFSSMGINNVGEKRRILVGLLEGPTLNWYRMTKGKNEESGGGMPSFSHLATMLQQEFGVNDKALVVREQLRQLHQGQLSAREYKPRYCNLTLKLPGMSTDESMYRYLT